MRSHQLVSARLSKQIVLALGLACSGALLAFVNGGNKVAAQPQVTIDASIFAYDGHDFVRVKTTLLTAEGKPALNTKLEHDTPAYKALIKKRSYTGDATLFGHKYDANYAPLTGEDGRLTGALFVGVPK
jgi:hypothetical protein